MKKMSCFYFLTWFSTSHLMASLVIAAYNDQAIYVASDSCLTQVNANYVPTHFKVTKLFKVSNSSCVSITGNYGMSFEIRNTGEVVVYPYLLNELARICAELSSNQDATAVRIRTVTNRFRLSYDNFVKAVTHLGTKPQALDGTRLLFTGYDEAGQTFFASSCYFQGTNRFDLTVAFARSMSNRIGSSIILQGESAFLPGLLSARDGPLPALRSDALNNAIASIIAEVSIPQDQVVNCLVEMFRLHKDFAATFSSEKGWIDAPYVIYKITKERVVQIH